jgi:AraC-like DNA-binding protein
MSTDSPQAVNHATFSLLANGVTLMQASFADHAFERHSHDCFAIGITTAGVQSFRCKGERYNSQVGDFVLFNPDEDHDGRPGTDDGFDYMIWYVPEELVASSLTTETELAGSRYFASPHVVDRPMAEAFRQLSLSLKTTPAEALRVESMQRAFLGTMLLRHAERPASDSASHKVSRATLVRVRDYMRTYYRSNITVAELANVAGLSRAHVTRAFSAAFHTPPHVYLNAVRVAQAQSLIRLGMPLATVALECGFADQSHLTRRFKGSIGVTPSAWRDMNKT